MKRWLFIGIFVISSTSFALDVPAPAADPQPDSALHPLISALLRWAQGKDDQSLSSLQGQDLKKAVDSILDALVKFDARGFDLEKCIQEDAKGELDLEKVDSIGKQCSDKTQTNLPFVAKIKSDIKNKEQKIIQKVTDIIKTSKLPHKILKDIVRTQTEIIDEDKQKANNFLHNIMLILNAEKGRQ